MVCRHELRPLIVISQVKWHCSVSIEVLLISFPFSPSELNTGSNNPSFLLLFTAKF